MMMLFKPTRRATLTLDLIGSDCVKAFVSALERRARQLGLKGTLEQKYGEHIYYHVRNLKQDIADYRREYSGSGETPNFNASFFITLELPEIDSWLAFIGDSKDPQLSALRALLKDDRLLAAIQVRLDSGVHQ